MVPRLPGSRTRSSPTQTRRRRGAESPSGRGVCCEDADHGLRIVAARQLLQDLRRDLENLAAGLPRRRDRLLQHRHSSPPCDGRGCGSASRPRSHRRRASGPRPRTGPLSSRTLRMASARMSLTSGLVRLVTRRDRRPARAARGRSKRRFIAASSANRARSREATGRVFLGDRQLARFERAADAGEDLAAEVVDRHEGGADRIGGEDDEGRLFRSTARQRASRRGRSRKRSQTSPRPAAIFRRIEHDAVIARGAPLLARRELHGVVDDPADRRVGEPGHRLVLAREADRLLGGIDMGHRGAGPGRQQRGDAGIAEQIEDAAGPAEASRRPSYSPSAAPARERSRDGGRA